MSGEPILLQMAPLSNLLQDCHAHGGGLSEPRSAKEFVSISASIEAQRENEITVAFDDNFRIQVHIQTEGVVSPPTSVWCYLEEYPVEGGPGIRLRQKVTGRKVEMYGTNKGHLTRFLASPRFTNTCDQMPNLYEKDGFRDYVLVSGGAAVDSYDVIRFDDGPMLTYLLGPTPDTAYRDAFRVFRDEAAAAAHSRTAVKHLEDGRYREAILSARLAVEVACGGREEVKRRLEGAPPEILVVANVLRDKRNVAVHEGQTRVELQDAREAIDAMHRVLQFLEVTSPYD